MAVAIAHPNIALVKYWGKRDRELNLPATGSISMTLDTFHTRTGVTWDTEHDVATLNGQVATGHVHERIFRHLDLITPGRPPTRVVSENNFPTAAGLASSSSAFAALTMAAAAEAGELFSPERLSELARQGSGSACRSFWGGFVEWRRGIASDGSDSHGTHIAPRDHWDLRMVVAIVDDGPKKIGSREGMIRTMETSPMYQAWVASAASDLNQARQAILERDLDALGRAMERSTLKMHATMLTSDPPIRYWKSTSVWAMDAVEKLRDAGVSAWWTMDAGPNVKILCRPQDAERVARRLRTLIDKVVIVGVGPGPSLLEDAER
ncbi:MAG: diphosphomevalonate decarboxylase [Alphaproteobacteria bacterium]|nr:diphosphomevalonate decarboxylase [Alphaproteobacteria bacterium]